MWSSGVSPRPMARSTTFSVAARTRPAPGAGFGIGDDIINKIF